MVEADQVLYRLQLHLPRALLHTKLLLKLLHLKENSVDIGLMDGLAADFSLSEVVLFVGGGGVLQGSSHLLSIRHVTLLLRPHVLQMPTHQLYTLPMILHHQIQDPRLPLLRRLKNQSHQFLHHIIPPNFVETL